MIPCCSMQTITIPKKISSKGDLIVVPRKDYEELLALKNKQVFAPSAAQKKALAQAERNLQKKKTLSYHELVKELGFTHRSKCC